MIAQPIEHFLSTLGISITEGDDDLGYFHGAALVLDEKISFALLHHRGDLPNTTIVYLVGQQLDGPDVTKSVNEIIRALGVEDALVTWRRDPPL